MTELWAPIVTTVGTLAGSFGGYLLAARAQRSTDERKDVRERGAAAATRAMQLEDERHDVQLRTLMALQDLVRQMTRHTLLVINQDRRTFEEHGTYFLLLEPMSADVFETSVNFALHVARVTDDGLRHGLDEFRSTCSAYSLLPEGAGSLSKESALQIQADRYTNLAQSSQAAASMLGVSLRAEIDRRGSLEAT